jgi:hypothetical protein
VLIFVEQAVFPVPQDHLERPFGGIMPRPGLCRVGKRLAFLGSFAVISELADAA